MPVTAGALSEPGTGRARIASGALRALALCPGAVAATTSTMVRSTSAPRERVARAVAHATRSWTCRRRRSGATRRRARRTGGSSGPRRRSASRRRTRCRRCSAACCWRASAARPWRSGRSRPSSPRRSSAAVTRTPRRRPTSAAASVYVAPVPTSSQLARDARRVRRAAHPGVGERRAGRVPGPGDGGEREGLPAPCRTAPRAPPEFTGGAATGARRGRGRARAAVDVGRGDLDAHGPPDVGGCERVGRAGRAGDVGAVALPGVGVVGARRGPVAGRGRQRLAEPRRPADAREPRVARRRRGHGAGPRCCRR